MSSSYRNPWDLLGRDQHDLPARFSVADITPDPSITGTVDVEARGAIQETNEDTIN